MVRFPFNERFSWTTRDGQEVFIDEVSDSHLINAYNFLKRKHPESENLKYFEYEMAYRKGDRDTMLSIYFPVGIITIREPQTQWEKDYKEWELDYANRNDY